MEGETAGDPDPGAEDPPIVSSVDRTGAYDRFVIADISVDDRWLGVRESEALTLRVWR